MVPMPTTQYAGCDPDGPCSTHTHTSLTCYALYFELEYEGPSSEDRIMTFEQWQQYAD